jgi:hypothetical protein
MLDIQSSDTNSGVTQVETQPPGAAADGGYTRIVTKNRLEKQQGKL